MACYKDSCLSSIVEEFSVAMCRVVMLLRDSTDNKVTDTGVTTIAGCKCTHISGTSRKYAEIERSYWQPLLGASGIRIHSLPVMGKI